MKLLLILLVLTVAFSCDLPEQKNQVSKPETESNPFAGTQWESDEVGYPQSKGKNLIQLTFTEDSVKFFVPSHDILLVADILGGIAGGKTYQYTWEYSVNDKRVVLDPGMTGYSIKLNRSGDSLVYDGKPPVPLNSFSFHKK